MSQVDKKEITVIGMGALGRTLLKAFYMAGYPIKSVYNRTQKKAQKWSESVEAAFSGTFPKNEEHLGNIIFICVSDDVIEDTARKFIDQDITVEGRIFVHCSGAKPASVMSSLATKGAKIVAFHPLQTFTAEVDPERFRNITISLQGDDSAIPLLSEIARNLGANPVRISGRDKIKLHIAAVMACNYLVTLTDSASEILNHTGISGTDLSKLQMLFPLIEQTVQNIKNKGPENSLSGPLKRGDIQTILSHLEELKELPAVRNLYSCLGSYTAGRLLEQDQLPEEKYKYLQNMFTEKSDT